MGKKNGKKPNTDKFIGLYNGRKGTYGIYSKGENGEHSLNSTPKNAKQLLPLIDRGTYKWATPRAKESLLDFPSSSKVSRLIKKLKEIESSKLI